MLSETNKQCHGSQKYATKKEQQLQWHLSAYVCMRVSLEFELVVGVVVVLVLSQQHSSLSVMATFAYVSV